jgi:hypothetical protein
LFPLVFLLSLPGASGAAVHCASNAAQLSAALDVAADNGEADDIRIREGTLLASASTRFRYTSSEPHGLRISGGWSDLHPGGCFAASKDATRTVLDGAGLGPVLIVDVYAPHAATPIAVEGLTLRNGYGDSWHASGLNVGACVVQVAANVQVDRVIVHDNQSSEVNIPAVKLCSDDGFVRFSNSIVRHNLTRGSTIWISSNHGASAVTHLSAVYNRYHGSGTPLHFNGHAAQITSSLFWGNGNYDLVAGGWVGYYSNRYGTGSDEALLNQHGLHTLRITDPQLQSATVPRPRATSPLRDATLWSVGEFDVYGRPRTSGGVADIGAAEY